MLREMLSVELLMSNTSNIIIVVSRGREIFNQVLVSGCDNGQVEDDIVTDDRRLGAKRWRDMRKVAELRKSRWRLGGRGECEKESKRAIGDRRRIQPERLSFKTRFTANKSCARKYTASLGRCA